MLARNSTKTVKKALSGMVPKKKKAAPKRAKAPKGLVRAKAPKASIKTRIRASK